MERTYQLKGEGSKENSFEFKGRKVLAFYDPREGTGLGDALVIAGYIKETILEEVHIDTIDDCSMHHNVFAKVAQGFPVTDMIIFWTSSGKKKYCRRRG